MAYHRPPRGDAIDRKFLAPPLIHHHVKPPYPIWRKSFIRFVKNIVVIVESRFG